MATEYTNNPQQISNILPEHLVSYIIPCISFKHGWYRNMYERIKVQFYHDMSNDSSYIILPISENPPHLHGVPMSPLAFKHGKGIPPFSWIIPLPS